MYFIVVYLIIYTVSKLLVTENSSYATISFCLNKTGKV